ncbi:HTH-type transcriptional repressor CytR [bacterium HR17]|uniref:HTH-type transcriptional repressor CytR n=1 Tax=Candidatus Fervidibacter japonicus TaxID=2035412 RepID=A0A2H5XCX2_9BACT|nr:HTH-type transcriptional repressor CytR [bacterium HR17]
MARHSGNVTIKDVAAAAGVSVATVSSVLNGRDHARVAAATRQRILETAQRLGYRPKRSAQALRTGLTGAVGLSVPLCPDALLSPFFYEAVRGALKAAKQRGWLVTILGFQDRQEELVLLQAAMEQRSVDGVVLFDPCDDDPRIPLLKGRLPFVVVGRCADPEVPTVDNDNLLAAKLATQHLLNLGHRRIAFVHIPLQFATAQDRLAGYRAALEEAGVPFEPNLLAEAKGYYGVEAGFRAFSALLDRAVEPPTAVLAMDDALALGVLQAAQRRGLRVSEDLAVIGFNDAPFSAHCEPPLTTVRIFGETLVAYATDMLLRLIHGEPVAPWRLLVPTQLIVRASCGAMKQTNPAA